LSMSTFRSSTFGCRATNWSTKGATWAQPGHQSAPKARTVT
jgi:hypothetical protein